MEQIYAHSHELLAFALMQILAVISPGADFAITVRNSLIFSRKTGLITVVGISLGILVHLVYIMLGLGVIISETPILFNIIKYTGGVYLIYLGVKGLMAKKQKIELGDLHKRHEISAIKAFSMGFITNIFNPKAIVYFLSVFTIFLKPDTPSVVMLGYALIIFLSTYLWFTAVALCFSTKKLRDKFSNQKHWIERITGALLIGVSLKLMIFS